DPVPAVVRQQAATIAIYWLMSRQGVATEGPEATIRKNYEDAIRWLEQVAAGKILLPAATGGESPPRDDGIVIVSSDRVFDRTKMQGF
ncbi:MAG: DUF1320 family protein, partial [Caulobacterales bacterium]|nr:DUF1320 family protein [Caulobacterales bacterium]